MKEYRTNFYEYPIKIDDINFVYDRMFSNNCDHIGDEINFYINHLRNEDLSIQPTFNEKINKRRQFNQYISQQTQEQAYAASLLTLLYNISAQIRDIKKMHKEPVWIPGYHGAVNGAKYSDVPELYFQQLKSILSVLKYRLDHIKKQRISSEFAESFISPIYNMMDSYFSQFDLYSPSFTEKAKDVAINLFIGIIMFIIFCVVFWLMAKACCS